MTHYDTLGVAPDASSAEIVAAYRRLAKQVHPDADPSASPDERRAREVAMAHLNLAYAATRRGSGPSSVTAQETDEPVRFPPTPRGACDVCGATPVERYVINLRSAWMVSVLPSAPELELCLDCARTFGVTLPEAVTAPRAPSRRSALRRQSGRGLRVVLAAMLVGIATLVAYSTVPTSSATRAVAVGACVLWSGGYTAVACGGPHSGRVVSVAPAPSACPARASFAHRRGKTFCIDTSQ